MNETNNQKEGVQMDAQKTTEQLNAEYDEMVVDGYKIRELRAAMERVQNPTNWKNPIDAIIDASDWDIVKRAIPFFTGSVPRVVYSAGEKLKIRAAGYYAAVGA